MMVVHLLHFVSIITRVIVRVHLHDDTIHDAINEDDDTEIFKNHVFSPKSPRAVGCGAMCPQALLPSCIIHYSRLHETHGEFDEDDF